MIVAIVMVIYATGLPDIAFLIVLPINILMKKLVDANSARLAVQRVPQVRTVQLVQQENGETFVMISAATIARTTAAQKAMVIVLMDVVTVFTDHLDVPLLVCFAVKHVQISFLAIAVKMTISVEIFMQNVNAAPIIVKFKMLASVPSALHHNGIHIHVDVAHAVLTVRTIHALVIKHAWNAGQADMEISARVRVTQTAKTNCATEMVRVSHVAIVHMDQPAICTVQM